jgi:hypothetical protein
VLDRPRHRRSELAGPHRLLFVGQPHPMFLSRCISCREPPAG